MLDHRRDKLAHLVHQLLAASPQDVRFGGILSTVALQVDDPLQFRQPLQRNHPQAFAALCLLGIVGQHLLQALDVAGQPHARGVVGLQVALAARQEEAALAGLGVLECRHHQVDCRHHVHGMQGLGPAAVLLADRAHRQRRDQHDGHDGCDHAQQQPRRQARVKADGISEIAAGDVHLGRAGGHLHSSGYLAGVSHLPPAVNVGQRRDRPLRGAVGVQ